MSRPFTSCTSLFLLAAGSAVFGYTNVKVNTFNNSPEECTIVVSPTNPNLVLAGAQSVGARYYRSTDGGLTFGDQLLPGQYNLGDPALTTDADGNMYYAYIGTFSHSGIFVNKSTDGGLTWLASSTPVIEHTSGSPFEDKEWPVCDWTTGQRRGWLYLTWTQFDHYGSPAPQDSSRILFARSTNGGVSFGPAFRISDRGGDAVDSDATVEGAVPAVGVDGALYCCWAGPRGLEFDRSTNGGSSWGVDRVISDQPGGWDFPMDGIYRANGLPIVKVDQSNGPHRGRVYVHWADHRNGDADLFLLYSDDGGTTFGPRVRVNDDPVGNGRDQFFSWLDVDPVTGSLYVVFYDRRNYPDTRTDVWLAISDDGGEHWSNERISSSPFTPNAGVFFGDYTGISAVGGKIRPHWARLDDTVLSVWTALIDRNPNAVEEPEVLFPQGTAAASGLFVHPNPMRWEAEVRWLRATPSPIRLTVADVSGRVVRELAAHRGAGPGIARWDGRDTAGRRVASGVYWISGESEPAARVVVVR